MIALQSAAISAAAIAIAIVAIAIAAAAAAASPPSRPSPPRRHDAAQASRYRRMPPKRSHAAMPPRRHAAAQAPRYRCMPPELPPGVVVVVMVVGQSASHKTLIRDNILSLTRARENRSQSRKSIPVLVVVSSPFVNKAALEKFILREMSVRPIRSSLSRSQHGMSSPNATGGGGKDDSRSSVDDASEIDSVHRAAQKSQVACNNRRFRC